MTAAEVMVAEVMVAEAPTLDHTALDGLFLAGLIQQVRAHDLAGLWDGQPNEVLLAGFLVSREQRRQRPILGEPDARLLQRLEQFYAATALAAEQVTGVIVTPLLKLHPEGWGRVVLTAGRLVVLSRSLRDVHRFGFATMAALAEGGGGLVAEAVAMIERYPDVARL